MQPFSTFPRRFHSVGVSRRAALVGALAPLGGAIFAQALLPNQNALSLGVLPNVSARLVLRNYAPVAQHLKRELGREVEVLSSKDFPEFYARGVAGGFDVVVTAANLARLMELDHGWQVQAVFEPSIPATLVRPKSLSGAPTDVAQILKGKKLAVANPQSLVVLRGLEWLAKQGLKLGADFELLKLPNEDSLPALLSSGEAPRAIMSMGEFRSLPGDVRAQLEVETVFAQVPGFMVVTPPSTTGAVAVAISQAFLGLAATPAGAEFSKFTGVTAIRAIGPGEMQLLDGAAAATRALMRAGVGK